MKSQLEVPADEGIVGEFDSDAKKISEILEMHRAHWLAIPGVNGVGQSLHDGRVCIKVYLSHGKVKGLPATVDGYRVITEIVGDFEKQL